MTEIAFAKELALSSSPISAVDLALYAAASGDHNPLHLDAEVARAAGFARPVVHGMLTLAWVARVFTREFGAGCIVSIETRFTGVALLGDVLHVTAALIGVEDGVARYELKARAATGTELVTGSARIATAAATHPAAA
ncbi:MAG TPA: MaoC family dehydratase [Caldimonas sp.]|jgi:acyl dehydratase|nr:MaoC family dehydratase [Caldimonas sp.]